MGSELYLQVYVKNWGFTPKQLENSNLDTDFVTVIDETRPIPDDEK